MTPRAFYHVGGDIIHRNRAITEADAAWLIKLFATEWRAAVRAQDEEATRRAAELHAELNSAWAKAKDWARCSGVLPGTFTDDHSGADRKSDHAGQQHPGAEQ